MRTHFAIKKSLVLVFVFSLLFVYCGNSNQKEKAAQQERKGKKNEIVEQDQKEINKAKEFKIKVRKKFAAFYNRDGSLPAEKVLAEVIEFNEQGLKVEHLRFTGAGIVDLRYTFQYDANGNLIVMDTYDGSGNLRARRESIYDKNNNEIERRFSNNRYQGENKILNKYDEDGNMIETQNLARNGSVISITKNKFESGFLVNSVTKNGMDAVQMEIDFTYDENGFLIKEDRKSGNSLYTLHYTYDNSGNLVEVVNPEMKRVYKYNENNNLIDDQMFWPDGGRQFKVGFTYNEKGLQLTETRYNTDDKPAFYSIYEYEFY